MIFYRVQYRDSDEEWLLEPKTFIHDLFLLPFRLEKIDLIRVVDISNYIIFDGVSGSRNYYRKL